VAGSTVTHACSSPLDEVEAPEEEVLEVEDVEPDEDDDDEVESEPPVHATAIAAVTNAAHPKMRRILRC